MDFLISLAIVTDELSFLDIFLASAIVLLIYIFALSKQNVSILDPILYYLVSSYFATTMATLYWLVNLISDEDFYWICICTFLYYLGFVLTSGFSKEDRILLKDNPPKSYLFLILCFFVINQIVIYSFYGIPLFMSSRLTQFVDAGGWGVISRFSTVLIPYLLFCSFLVYQKIKINLLLILLVIVLVIFLSGSKAAILNVFWFYFIANKIIGSKKIKIKAIYFILTFILSLIVIAIQNDFNDFLSAFNQFGIRLLAFGDVYSYAYINNALKIIAHKDYMALVYPLLQPLRVISPD